MRTVAALYIDPRGPYPKMEGVDCWDEKRDARLYDGPHPVVAHPPCGPWGRLRQFCTKQDGTLALRAVEQVRAWGGALEHPSGSLLFAHIGLPMPGEGSDAFGGRSYEVDQCDWSHPARKRTWLYIVGVDSVRVLNGVWARRGTGTPTHVISTSRRRVSPLPELTVKWQRAITPPLFAEWLVSLARSAT